MKLNTLRKIVVKGVLCLGDCDWPRGEEGKSNREVGWCSGGELS